MKKFFKLYWNNIKIDRTQLKETIIAILLILMGTSAIGVVIIPALIIGTKYILLGVLYFFVTFWLVAGALKTFFEY